MLEYASYHNFVEFIRRQQQRRNLPRIRAVHVTKLCTIAIHACIYIYMLTPPPHDPHEAAFSKQWIMGGGQPRMRKHRQGSNFPKILEA